MKISEINISYSPNQLKGGRVKINNSQDAFKLTLNSWNSETIELIEEFKLILLNRANEVLGIHVLSKGGMTGTLVDVRILFAVALKSAACGIILAHNHPSGNLKSSEADRRLYHKVKKAAEFLDIKVLDNLIISKDGYSSFADEGII